jgi:signal transduction histidine kinase
MLDFFKHLFDADFIPHGHCYFWQPEVVWLHVVSDSLITLSYYAMPAILLYFVRRRRDLPFSWMFLLFGAFILACGTTHLMEVWTLWVPTYRLSGAVKLMTAAISMTTALLLIPLVPQALALRAPAELAREIDERTDDLRRANEALQGEIAQHRQAEGALRQVEDQVRRLNAELEERVHQRTTQLEAANQELEAFSYSVSHDLRAPLRGISGFSKALMEDYAAQLDEQGQHYLKRIDTAAAHMGDLIDDMLSLARVTRTEMTYRAVDLSALAQAVAAELRKTNPDRRVDLTIAPNITAQGDERLLRIMMENLLGNAWKYTSKQPSAHVQFHATTMGALQSKATDFSPTTDLSSVKSEARVFFVRDDGAGFDMKYADRLFGAFQRLHTSREFEGTGIGLATVQRIIRRHGGRVWAEAAVGRGATFYFTLPPA